MTAKSRCVRIRRHLNLLAGSAGLSLLLLAAPWPSAASAATASRTSTAPAANDLLPLLAGKQLKVEDLLPIVYEAGFKTEEQILKIVQVAIRGSSLWTASRYWQPDFGYREPGANIKVKGPEAAWSKGRQVHSARGLWQLSSYWWPALPDELADDPAKAAATIFEISEQGQNFSIVESYLDGTGGDFFDKPQNGWPALRPLVRDFLARAQKEPPVDRVVAVELSEEERAIAEEMGLIDPEAAKDFGIVDKPLGVAEPDAKPPTPTETETADPAPAGPVVAEAAEPRIEGAANPEADAGQVDALQSAAEAGNPWAMIGLAEILIEDGAVGTDSSRVAALLDGAAASGLAGPALGMLGAYQRAAGDFDAALSALRTASDNGDSRASLQLAAMLLGGEGIAADPEQAVDLLQGASQSGLAGSAQLLLASHYQNAGDMEQTVVALEKAVSAGEGEAKLRLGRLLIGGDGVAADTTRGAALLEEAAEAGFTGPAKAALGRYLRKSGDSAAAIAMLEESIEAGESEAKLLLGEMLLAGDGVGADADRAALLLQEAADAGWKSDAFKALAEAGESDRGLAALEAAADAGDAEARLALGEALVGGRDVARGVALLKEAVDTDLSGRAALALGLHQRRQGDAAGAAAALERAVKAGSPAAKVALAEMLIAGEGVTSNRKRAVGLLEEASDAGLKAEASRVLAGYHLKGGNKASARKAFEQAIEAGDSQAKIDLALMLSTGKTADRARARDLLASAATEDGNISAYRALIALSAAEFRHRQPLEPAIAFLRDARLLDASLALSTFEELQENEKAALIQAILQKVGLYKGKTDGQLTLATLKAINAYCSRNDIDECRSEAMPKPLLSALIEEVSADS